MYSTRRRLLERLPYFFGNAGSVELCIFVMLVTSLLHASPILEVLKALALLEM